MRPRFNKRGDLNKMNQLQRSILVGLLLGDGHLETITRDRTYRLKVEHSLKQKEYVDWLYEQFKDFVSAAPYTKERELKGKKSAWLHHIIISKKISSVRNVKNFSVNRH